MLFCMDFLEFCTAIAYFVCLYNEYVVYMYEDGTAKGKELTITEKIHFAYHIHWLAIGRATKS